MFLEPTRQRDSHTVLGLLTLCFVSMVIALFTVNFSHLHYNVIQPGCEAISG